MLKDSMNCNTTDSFLICRAVNVSLQSWGCVVEEGQLLLLLLLQGGQPDCLGREGVFFFHSLAQKQSDLVNKSWSVWLKCCSSFRWREDLQIITLLTLIHETKWNAFFFPTWFFFIITGLTEPVGQTVKKKYILWFFLQTFPWWKMSWGQGNILRRIHESCKKTKAVL